MMIALNEYIHEAVKFEEPDTKGLWRVIYEPCENLPVKSLTGSIYLDGDAIQTFEVDCRDVITSVTKRAIRVINGCFIPTDGTLILFWSREPQEHFLCISYRYEKAKIRKPNWLREGF